MQCVVVLLIALACTVRSLPLDSAMIDTEQNGIQTHSGHSLWKRFVNPMFTLDGPSDSGIVKMRTKREAEDPCEKLALCKLHANSHRSFISAFELYFVNKENARLWDHHSRSIQDCEDRFGDCYDE